MSCSLSEFGRYPRKENPKEFLEHLHQNWSSSAWWHCMHCQGSRLRSAGMSYECSWAEINKIDASLWLIRIIGHSVHHWHHLWRLLFRHNGKVITIIDHSSHSANPKPPSQQVGFCTKVYSLTTLRNPGRSGSLVYIQCFQIFLGGKLRVGAGGNSKNLWK